MKCTGAWRKGISRVQMKRELDRVILKKAKGEKLTRREERILAYGSSLCRCSCGVRR
jgi:hypothetical protein